LFCNAGILSTLGLNWKLVFYLLFTDPVGLLERADATIQPVGEINEDGMGRVFACNVFGHYVMVTSQYSHSFSTIVTLFIYRCVN
jgi:NAD(P)-dependent dehydrogenase (short-subunit alcohol dehydrogenase family)